MSQPAMQQQEPRQQQEEPQQKQLIQDEEIISTSQTIEMQLIKLIAFGTLFVVVTNLTSYYWPLITLIQKSTDTRQRFDYIGYAVTAFCFVYIGVVVLVRSMTDMKDTIVPMIVASRCISTLHASIVVVSGFLAVKAQNHSSWFDMISIRMNTPSEQRIFEVSAGFFIVDIIVLLFKTRGRINNKESTLLMCHHLIALSFMLTSGYFGQDSATVVVGLAFAESTSPFVSMWTIARATQSRRHLTWTSPLFTVTFGIMRFVAMTWSLIVGVPCWLSSSVNDAVPFSIRVYWCITYFLLCFGGWIWAKDAITGLRSYYKKQQNSNRQSTSIRQVVPVCKLPEEQSSIVKQAPITPMKQFDSPVRVASPLSPFASFQLY